MTQSKRRTKTNRKAFTLVELLVVITIIGMLMAMILPAVAAVKEHARMTLCINNQTEISKAILAFEMRKSRFPGFNEKLKRPNSDDTNLFGWPVVLLPELGRRDLYEAMLIEGASSSRVPPPNSARSYVEVLVCPSAHLDKDADALSYVVNSGRRDDNNGDTAANGIFHDRNRDGPLEVSNSTRGDGVANTLMISEKLNVLPWGHSAANEQFRCFIWWPTEDPPFGTRINQDKENEVFTFELARPASNHPGGVVASFCNGSTRFIREDIDYRVHIQLMTPNQRRATKRWGDPLPDELKNYILKEQDY
jgi:prepilin-type N-terminal cleavage/methylation domain-containing protein